jgi:hypothetical protein
MKNFLLGILILLAGCTAQKKDIPKRIKETKNLTVYPEDAEPDSSVELIRETTFEVPDNISMNWYDSIAGYSWLAGIEVGDSGRVFIGDRKRFAIHVFDSDGRYLRSLGQKGRGPGEFLGIGTMQIVSNRLFVFDYAQYKISIYHWILLKSPRWQVLELIRLIWINLKNWPDGFKAHLRGLETMGHCW